ncbi:HEPN domain-containing protein [Candidatus Woesearchaeota archaeon]|nr:HEPN domain-containing protein [Candidatus Woesearchaeota archaeon]
MEELLKNIKMFLKSAKLVYDSRDYTSATILYFKSVFVILDYIIFRSEGKTPKDHSERFRILEEGHPDLYLFLDKYFHIYRYTYSLKISKTQCDEVRRKANEIIRQYKIPI